MHISRGDSNRPKKNKKLLEAIKPIYRKSHGIYVAPKIKKNLQGDQKASKGRIARLMQSNG